MNETSLQCEDLSVTLAKTEKATSSPRFGRGDTVNSNRG